MMRRRVSSRNQFIGTQLQARIAVNDDAADFGDYQVQIVDGELESGLYGAVDQLGRRL